MDYKVLQKKGVRAGVWDQVISRVFLGIIKVFESKNHFTVFKKNTGHVVCDKGGCSSSGFVVWPLWAHREGSLHPVARAALELLLFSAVQFWKSVPQYMRTCGSVLCEGQASWLSLGRPPHTHNSTDVCNCALWVMGDRAGGGGCRLTPWPL